MQTNAVVNELYLYNTLKHIFSKFQVHQNVQKKLNLKHPNLKTYLEYDVWIPELNLCFEFQDAHHYMTTSYYQLSKSHIRNKDKIKGDVALSKDLTLISVPCWWNGNINDLLGSICFSRPDMNHLISHYSFNSLINLNPPPGYFKDVVIPGVGELMLASFPRSDFNNMISNFNWWIGEKYDGIRCCWNPVMNTAYSRYGNQIHLLTSITSSLPNNIHVDSELWFGRGQYYFSYALVNDTPHSNWCYLRMIAFDVPSFEYQKHKYEERYKLLLSSLSSIICNVAPRIKCNNNNNNNNNISYFTHEILDGGGEGLIFQKSKSFYDQGRSQNVIKLKTSLGDQEGIVVGVTKKNSIHLKLPTGVIFTVQPENIFVSEKIKTGDIVSFSFEKHARAGVPVNCKVFRIRKDVNWDHVVNNFISDKHYLNKVSSVKVFTSQPPGYWTPKNMKEYMLEFASSKGLDPLLPDTWYNSFTDFYKSKSGRIILGKYKNSYFSALQHLFPEITFNSSFNKTDYTKVENRRAFFENYAKKNGFDPLVADDWYSQSIPSIFASPGTRSVIFYHGYSIPKALIDLFPNIGLDRFKFNMRQNLWEDSTNRKQFFINYASDNNFDPNIPDNWHKEPYDKILASKGAHRVLSYHDNNVPTALLELFPNIGLERSKFKNYLNLWHSKQNRRRFFETYAQANSFDPLNANAWYSQSAEKIMTTKGARMVMYYHNKSVSSALVELFPEVSFRKPPISKSRKMEM